MQVLGTPLEEEPVFLTSSPAPTMFFKIGYLFSLGILELIALLKKTLNLSSFLRLQNSWSYRPEATSLVFWGTRDQSRASRMLGKHATN